MKTQHIVRRLHWNNCAYTKLELGPSTTLAWDDGDARLAHTEGPYGKVYSTANDLFTKSEILSVPAIRSFDGFEAAVIDDTDNTGVTVTSVKFRLDPDDGSEYYWDGGAWVAAGASDWNTEAEVASNITSWSVAIHGSSLRIVANLKTTNPQHTPRLRLVKLLTRCVINYEEDIIYRSLLPLLKTVRVTGRQVVAMPATGTTLLVSTLALESGYNVQGIDSVFSYSTLTPAEQTDLARNNPRALPDLFNSYDGTTITLASSVTIGTLIWINFIYQPTVAVNTSQDFVDAAMIPSLIVDNVGFDLNSELPNGEDFVTDKTAGTATVVPAPEQGDFQLVLQVVANSQVNLWRLSQAAERLFSGSKVLNSTALGIGYRLWLIAEFKQTGGGGQDEVYMGELRFRIMNVLRWLRPSYQEFITDNLITTVTRSN